jgi:hypothetical protein
LTELQLEKKTITWPHSPGVSGRATERAAGSARDEARGGEGSQGGERRGTAGGGERRARGGCAFLPRFFLRKVKRRRKRCGESHTTNPCSSVVTVDDSAAFCADTTTGFLWIASRA